MPYKDLTGQRFGRLVAIKRVLREGQRTKWLCKCDCGNEKEIPLSSLSYGRCKSCGCLRKEVTSQRYRKHGHSNKNDRLYNVWLNMRTRCNNPNCHSYEYYGGRGITVSDEWDEFNNFKEWALNNGYSDELTIDRIDVNKGYSPSNCRWATKDVQANNTRNNVKVEIDGVVRTLSEHARFYGVNYYALHYRYEIGKRGRDLLTPTRSKLKVFMNGRSLTLKELSKETGLEYALLQYRYNNGWRGQKLIQPKNEDMSKRAKQQNKRRKLA